MGKRKRTRTYNRIKYNEEGVDIDKELDLITNPKESFYTVSGSKNRIKLEFFVYHIV